LDDCAESYLLNCIRGKEGFLPIPFHTELSNGSCINRPFLFNRKKELMAYAERNNLLQYVVEDETNLQVRGSRRNLLRNNILPILEKENVGLTTIVKKKMVERLSIQTKL
jgi:tRNA(Ile)-lysidine synthase TilS/MesJ